MHEAALEVLRVLRDLAEDGALEAVYGVDMERDTDAPLEHALAAWLADGAPLPGDPKVGVVHLAISGTEVRCAVRGREGTYDPQEVTCKRCRSLLLGDAKRSVREIDELARRRVRGQRLTKGLLRWSGESRESLSKLRSRWAQLAEELEE